MSPAVTTAASALPLPLQAASRILSLTEASESSRQEQERLAKELAEAQQLREVLDKELAKLSQELASVRGKGGGCTLMARERGEGKGGGG